MSFYDDASLIMYPSGYKADKIYSLKPTDGSGDFDFARASTATRVNADGLIESVATGVPRIDYTGGGCGSLLLEKQSTNVVTYSNDFSNAAWTKVNSTITANDTTSPDGTQNASRLVISSSGYLLRQYTASVSAGGSWALSIFAKNQITNFLRFGGATPSGTDTYSIQDMGNGWYRHFLTRTFASANASFNLQYLIGEVGTHYIYGAQAEAVYPTSYIPTAGATVTRLADVSATTGMASLINDSEGVLYFSGSLSSFDAAKYITLSDGTNNNRVQITFGTSGQAVMNIVIAGAVEMSESSSLGLLTANNQLKIAFKYKANDFALWLDGSEVASSVIGSTFAPAVLTDLKFALGNGGSPFYGEVQELIVFPTALTDTELATLTTL